MRFDDFVSFSTNKCHRSDRGLRLSPKIISDPQAISTTTTTANIKQNKEMRRQQQHQTTTTCLSTAHAAHRTRKHISQVKWTPRCNSPADMASSILLIFFLCLLWPTTTTTVLADPSAEPTIQQQQQQQGGLLPFPEGRGPDGTLYKTDYRCEGENMTISCEDSDGPGLNGIISVVRANFGRFSIAICNRHGQTDWSVNCMAPQTTKILQQRCDGQESCVVPVDSNVFHDACPGTFKYLEAHYACRSSQQQQQQQQPQGGSKRGPPLPPWLFDGNHGAAGTTNGQTTVATNNQRRPWANRDHAVAVKPSVNGGSSSRLSTPSPSSQKSNNKNSSNFQESVEDKKEERRKPILVTEKMEPIAASPTVLSTTATSRRVPITTPKPTTTKSSLATTTMATATSSTASSSIESTTPKILENDVFRNIEKTTISSAKKLKTRNEEEEDSFGGSAASSSPVTTFTISSKYEKEEFGKSFVSSPSLDTDSNVSDNSLNAPSITTSCPPVTSRKLQWDWTPVGEISIQPCPIGATGLAKWNCIDVSVATADTSSLDTSQNVHPQWYGSQPDMSDCKSVAMSNLEAQVRKEDPENVLISSLSYVTRTKALYGGDLESAVAIMRTVASRVQYRLQSSGNVFHNKENHIRQVLQNVLQSASNILEKSNRRAWLDLRPERRMKVATSLLLALEESAFLLAGVLNEPNYILETYEILTLAISAVEVDYRERELDGESYSNLSSEKVTFPSKRLLYVDDAIELYKNDVEAYGQEGLAEAVFFSYTTLHEILEAGKLNFGGKNNPNGDWRLNSRVVSASLGQGRHVELTHPVRIYLRHIVTENMTDAVCVYWDFEVHGWSDEGCRVVGSNSTMTQCECNHLTNFAVVMKPNVNGVTQDLLTSIRLDIVAYIIASVVTLALFVVIVRFRKRVFQWCRCSSPGGIQNIFCCCFCCHRNDKQSHLEKCQSFYTGLSRSSNGNLVMGPNGLQCSTPNTSKTRFFTGPNRAHSQYVLTNQQMMQQQGGHSATLAPSTTSTSLLTQPLMSAAHHGPGSRAHITLNPYSTQLVENINMMMPDKSSGSSSSATNSSSSTTSTTLGRNSHQQSCSMAVNPHLMNLTTSLRRDSTPLGFHGETGQASVINIDPMAMNGDVVYRAVSPHGHVYWEIDPSQVYGTNNNRKPIQSMSEENVALLVHHGPVVSPSGYHPHQQYMDEEEQQSLLLHHHHHQHHMQQQQQHHQNNFGGGEMRPLLMQQSNNGNIQFQHCPSLDDLNADHLNSHTGRIMMATSSSNNLLSHSSTNSFLENGSARKSAFVRTGANRFRHANNNTQQHSKRLTNADRQQQQQQHQQTLSTVSASLMAQHQQQQQQHGGSGMVPEQLQTQVQIKDIRPIQVSVKSSEYIEAKIRTLRKSAK